MYIWVSWFFRRFKSTIESSDKCFISDILLFDSRIFMWFCFLIFIYYSIFADILSWYLLLLLSSWPPLVFWTYSWWLLWHLCLLHQTSDPLTVLIFYSFFSYAWVTILCFCIYLISLHIRHILYLYISLHFSLKNKQFR